MLTPLASSSDHVSWGASDVTFTWNLFLTFHLPSGEAGELLAVTSSCHLSAFFGPTPLLSRCWEWPAVTWWHPSVPHRTALAEPCTAPGASPPVHAATGSLSGDLPGPREHASFLSPSLEDHGFCWQVLEALWLSLGLFSKALWFWPPSCPKATILFRASLSQHLAPESCWLCMAVWQGPDLQTKASRHSALRHSVRPRVSEWLG